MEIPEPHYPQIDVPQYASPFDGVVTAGQPEPAQLEEAAEKGIKTVIDLRRPEEDRGYDEAALSEKLGMEYIQLPIAGGDDLTRENAEKLAEHLDEAEGPFIVHCGSSNRVGALFALKAFYVDDADLATALEIGKKAGMTSLAETTRQRLEE
jgi:uncharacterized protein (TIGR01244 family)